MSWRTEALLRRQERGADDTIRQSDRVPGVGRDLTTNVDPSAETVVLTAEQADELIARELGGEAKS